MNRAAMFTPPADAETPLSVSQLTEGIKTLLESSFPSVWVAGEVSNLSRPSSGHCYFTLKDDRAQIRAVMWRGVASRVRFDLADGLEVLCQGSLDVYAPRGSYQLVIRQIQPKGVGALELALRKLRERLTAEGLFDPRFKRPLPAFPRRIAVVTSPTGAAVRDFLEVLRRRAPALDVLIAPVRVQGAGAAAEIVAAIESINRRHRDFDCLVVTRGGGSLEDLWAFNEESVVRAIHASTIPVISAIGHEIDVTLADLVADVRALTPSEAAERVAPAAEEIVAALGLQQSRLTAALRNRAANARARLDGVADRRVFRRPLERVQQTERRLDEIEVRVARAVRRRLSDARRVADGGAARLDSLSPLRVLGRGYSLTWKTDDGAMAREAAALSVGERITTRLAVGGVVSTVAEVVHDEAAMTPNSQRRDAKFDEA